MRPNNQDLPKRPIRIQVNNRGRNGFSYSDPSRNPLNSKPEPYFNRNKEVYRIQNQANNNPSSQNYNRSLSLAASLYPCLDTAIIKEILIEENLTLNDRSLKSLNDRCNVLNSHAHPHHLNEIELSHYKTEPCKYQSLCKNTYCNDYHFLGERRRSPVIYAYALCPVLYNCPKGDSCEYSHNFIEQAYHPKRILEFYQAVDIESFENVDLNNLAEYELERVKENKLSDKAQIIQKLENRLIYLRNIKKKFYCSGCNNSIATFLSAPCGHLICFKCKLSDNCLQCGKKCIYYQVNRNS